MAEWQSSAPTERLDAQSGHGPSLTNRTATQQATSSHMSHNRPLSGKTAVVTGASRGIGKAIAQELASRGANIAFNYLRNHAAARETERELTASGIEAFRYRANVGNQDAVQEFAQAVTARFSLVDILVNNAASGVMRSATDLDTKHWDWTLDTNAKGPWLLTAALADAMPSGSRVINISSPGSTRVLNAYFAVGVSKAALETVTRYMAIDLAPRGISVNTVSASFVDTDALNAFPDDLGVKQVANRPTPAGRPVTAQDVANVVALLCAPEADMIRGQTITVDGGEMLLHR